MKRKAKIFSKLIITATLISITLFLVNGCGREEIQRLQSEKQAMKNENETLKSKITSLEQEISKLKETAEFHYQQGVNLLKDNKFQEAKVEFDTVIEKYPESPLVSSAKENLDKMSREIRRVEAEKLAADEVKAEKERSKPLSDMAHKSTKDVSISGLSSIKSGVFGVKWGAPPTGLTKNSMGAYEKDGVTYTFSSINQFCMAGKKITHEEVIALVKQFTDRYGKPELKEQGQKWGKSYDWIISNVPFDFNGEIHPTDVTITVTTGGSEHGPNLVVVNPDIYSWGVFQKTRKARSAP